MNCLRGGRVVTRGVGACQFDSHRRLWWRRAVVAAAFIFPRPAKLITDFIEFYNIYITIGTERTCWKCLDSRYVKIRPIVLVLMTHLLSWIVYHSIIMFYKDLFTIAMNFTCISLCILYHVIALHADFYVLCQKWRIKDVQSSLSLRIHSYIMRAPLSASERICAWCGNTNCH